MNQNQIPTYSDFSGPKGFLKESSEIKTRQTIFIVIAGLFTYVAPLSTLRDNPSPSSPTVAMLLLVFGIILWLLFTLMIYGVANSGAGVARRQQKILRPGIPATAQVISSQTMHQVRGNPLRKLKLRFTNLAGYPVTAKVETIDNRPYERRFEPGSTVELRLNRDGVYPAFAIVGNTHEPKMPLWGWAWVIFNIVYAVGLFFFTRHLMGSDSGLTFLSVKTAWFVAPIIGLVMLFIPNPDRTRMHNLGSPNETPQAGELLLHGITVTGEVVDYWRTGMVGDDTTEYEFKIHYRTLEDYLIEKSYKEFIRVDNKHLLNKGSVEIQYLPCKPEIFRVKEVEDLGSAA